MSTDVPEASQARMLETMERLLELPATELSTTLTHACDLVAAGLRADKVDAFLFDARRQSLVAVGSSMQPLSTLQRRLGLDVLPLSNGGRVVHVFQTGETFVTGHLEDDPGEIQGVKEALKVRSQVGVPLMVGGQRRGMMMAASQTPDLFTEDDVRFARVVVRWVGMIAHRAELAEQIARNAVEQGRRAAAEELVTVIAHDLRNLVAPIAARLALLEARARREGRDADVRDADAASRALKRLGGLITDILDVARIDQGLFQVEAHPMDLCALAGEVARTLSTPDHPVRVSGAGEVVVYADAARIRQCLENVLSNAIQHSPANAAVTVLIDQQSGDDQREECRLDVVDEGPGIPPELMPTLFERFATGKSSRGLGLGLYLAQQIARAHGGTLEATASPGRGARFILRLPCFREQGPGTAGR
jgi:two-component system, OmpR family, sensor kinase